MVELIPIIELGFKEEESQFIQPFPEGNYWINPDKWEKIFYQRIQANGYEPYQRIMNGYPFYRINQFNTEKDLIQIIHFHLGGLKASERIPLSESCPLFGGYVLKLDGQIIFTPQCCGDLSDFKSWKSIIQDSFSEGYICLEGHPYPKVEHKSNQLYFSFQEEWEEFIPPAINAVVNKLEMIKAIQQCEIELNEFSKKLNALKDHFQYKNIPNILIYG